MLIIIFIFIFYLKNIQSSLYDCFHDYHLDLFRLSPMMSGNLGILKIVREGSNISINCLQRFSPNPFKGNKQWLIKRQRSGDIEFTEVKTNERLIDKSKPIFSTGLCMELKIINVDDSVRGVFKCIPRGEKPNDAVEIYVDVEKRTDKIENKLGEVAHPRRLNESRMIPFSENVINSTENYLKERHFKIYNLSGVDYATGFTKCEPCGAKKGTLSYFIKCVFVDMREAVYWDKINKTNITFHYQTPICGCRSNLLDGLESNILAEISTKHDTYEEATCSPPECEPRLTEIEPIQLPEQLSINYQKYTEKQEKKQKKKRKPTIADITSNYDVVLEEIEGSTIIIKCAPSPTSDYVYKRNIAWYQLRHKVLYDLSQRSSYSSRFQYKKKPGLLIINKLIVNDTAVYYCFQNNLLRSSVKLQVNLKPDYRDIKSPVGAMLYVTLFCVAVYLIILIVRISLIAIQFFRGYRPLTKT